MPLIGSGDALRNFVVWKKEDLGEGDGRIGLKRMTV